MYTILYCTILFSFRSSPPNWQTFKVSQHRYVTKTVGEKKMNSPCKATARPGGETTLAKALEEVGREEELACASGLRGQSVLQKGRQGWRDLAGPQARQEWSCLGKSDRQGPELVMPAEKKRAVRSTSVSDSSNPK